MIKLESLPLPAFFPILYMPCTGGKTQNKKTLQMLHSHGKKPNRSLIFMKLYFSAKYIHYFLQYFSLPFTDNFFSNVLVNCYTSSSPGQHCIVFSFSTVLVVDTDMIYYSKGISFLFSTQTHWARLQSPQFLTTLLLSRVAFSILAIQIVKKQMYVYA